MREWIARAAGLLGFGRRDRDLEEEVRFHLEMSAADIQRHGLDSDDARRAALRQFGGVMQMKEAYREQRSLPGFESVLQDVRYAIRTLVRSPGFALAALVTMALGIGANAAIFSVVNAVLLRPLPYPEPDRLVQLVREYRGGQGTRLDGWRYLFFREHLGSVEALAASSGAGSFNLVNGERAEFVTALGVSKEYFAVYATPPAIGRAFAAEHDVSGGPDVAILSHGLWTRQFGQDPSVLDRSILLGDRSFTIVGVMPASFRAASPFDLLLPLRPSVSGRGGGFNFTVVGRLRPGVTVGQATGEADLAWKQLQQLDPGRLMKSERSASFVPLQQTLSSTVRPALLMMVGAVGALLLIACANTANLLLARASGRAREIAMRAALGAGRLRIVRQLLTESVLLAVVGGWLGVLIAGWTMPVLISLTPAGFIAANQDVRVDGFVLLVAFGVSVATGILFGLAPAMSLSRRDLVEAIRGEGRTTSGRGAAFMRKALVIAEVAMCMLLLIGAALLIRTFVNLRSIDPGFDPDGVLTAQMSMQGERYADRAALSQFYEQGLARIRQLPGVSAAAVTSGLPLAYALNLNVDTLDGPERFEDALTDWRYVTPGYFETMRIPLIAGRTFTEADRTGAQPVAVVSQEFARRFFKGTNAIGHHIRVYEADGSIEIVGVVKDLKEGPPRSPAFAVMYVPAAQASAPALKTTHSYFQVNWVVRAANSGALREQIAAEIRAVDPRQPVSAFRTMDDLKGVAVANERFQMTLLGLFAGIGLLLAAAGIYGLLAYSVAQRTREFGIRIALGATRRHILAAVMWHGAALALAGIVIGGAAAFGLARLLQNLVWGVSTTDPITFAGVAAALLTVALLASAVPALRAVRLDPIAALRQ